MDFINKFPGKQEGKIFAKNVPCFAMSLQGSSHIDTNVPCQDYSDICSLDQQGLIISAIADGVGSCKLSHWGSYVAVKSTLDFLTKEIKNAFGDKKVILDASANEKIKRILIDGFRTAQKSVETMADDANITVYNFQSTLTVAIYDGCNLVFGHVGDDGIVAQTLDGEVDMITARLKGEEASSVYPLQSGERYWTFGRSSKPVAAFMMATDGVLDAFVSKRQDNFGINYFNGVCYSFMEEAVYKLAEGTEAAAEDALNKYKEYMLSDAYRNVVTDDLTLVAVVSKDLIKKSKHPEFSKEIWDTIEKESLKQQQNKLWGKSNENNQLVAPIDTLEMSIKKGNNEVPVIVKPYSKINIKAVCLASALSLLIGLGIGIVLGRTVLSSVNEKDYKALQIKYEDMVNDSANKSDLVTKLKDEIVKLNKQLQSIKKTDAINIKKEELNSKEIEKIEDSKSDVSNSGSTVKKEP